jgi:hypothetical protein
MYEFHTTVPTPLVVTEEYTVLESSYSTVFHVTKVSVIIQSIQPQVADVGTASRYGG